jgi:hypothetical protein
MFRCLLHHLQGDQCITCSKTICFSQCCYKMYNIQVYYIFYSNILSILSKKHKIEIIQVRYIFYSNVAKSIYFLSK